PPLVGRPPAWPGRGVGAGPGRGPGVRVGAGPGRGAVASPDAAGASTWAAAGVSAGAGASTDGPVATSGAGSLAGVGLGPGVGGLGPGVGAGAAGACSAAFGASSAFLAGARLDFLAPCSRRRSPCSSVSRRTTGASTVEDADFTYSPISLRVDRTTLLSTPSSRASSWTLTATLLLQGTRP